MTRSALLLFVVALLALPTGRVRANAGDVAGFGSEAIARGGAMAAVSRSADALHYNPAGLIAAERAELSIGYMRFLSSLSWQGDVVGGGREGQSVDLAQPNHISFGVVLPLGERFTVAAYINTLPTKLLSVSIQAPSEPTISYYQNRTQRIVVMVGGALDFGRGFSIGATVGIFGGVDGLVLVSEGPTRDVEPGIFLGADTVVTGNLGMRLEATDALTLGLTYRQAFRVPVKIQALSSVGNVPLDLRFVVDAMQTPHELVAGGALALGDLALSLDVTWQRWRNLREPWVDVDTRVTGLPIESPPLDRVHRDAVDIRLGGAYDVELSDTWGLSLRAGARFETTMARAQSGTTNLIDGNKLGVAAGFGIQTLLYDLPLRLDAHFSADHMFDRTLNKAMDSGSRFTRVWGGGQFYSVGLTLTLGLTP